MSTIVVRASDSALAMDEVIRRLGPNAMILSTSNKNGQVEIKATTDAPKPKLLKDPANLRLVEAEPVISAQPIEKTEPVLSAKPIDHVPPVSQETSAPEALTFADVLAARQKKMETLEAEPEAADKPILPPIAPLVPGNLGPSLDHPFGGWAGYTPEFLADLRSEIAIGCSDGAGFVSRLAKALVLDQSEQATGRFARTLIVGPSGSGKSLLAARLAGEWLGDDTPKTPRLIVPSRTTQLFPDRLAGQARLMGLKTERPLLKDLMERDEWQNTTSAPQVFDLSEIEDLTADELESLIIKGQTEVILVLPTGMHPVLMAQSLSRWKSFAPRIALSRTDAICPTPEELCAIASTGLKLGHVSLNAGIPDAITQARRETVVAWAISWLQGPFAAQVAR